VGLLASNLLAPGPLFFALGLAAARSRLELPAPVPRLLALYLLTAIGFKGGVALRAAGWSGDTVAALAAAALLSALTPVLAYGLLRRLFGRTNAAALAATYGSVSAVTFVTAVAYLDALDIPSGGHMVAALALMEAPAILVAVALHRRRSGDTVETGALLRETLLDGSVVLLTGSLVVGALSTPESAQTVAGLFVAPFPGVLALFLLEMGLSAARSLREVRDAGVAAIAVALVLPLLNGALGLAAAALFGLAAGDAVLLVVLAASASYIAVPAALREAIPEANPGLYLSMSLGITFPFNILVGLPLYAAVVQRLW
jgi:hypothetical protein